MKKNVVVATAINAKRTELGAVELWVKDQRNQLHTVVFLPTDVQALRDKLQENASLPGVLLEAQSTGTLGGETARKVLGRVAAIERSQSAGWSVRALPTEQTVALAVRDPDGAATLTLLDAAQTQRLVETLQQALALLNPASGTAH